MKYCVYTDGACNHDINVMASAFFIRTRYNFIGIESVPFKGNNIAIAESLALGIACEFMLKNKDYIEPTDTIEIYTDSNAVIKFFSDFKNEKAVPKSGDTRVIMAWNLLRELNSICAVKIKKIEAHQAQYNGNKVADRLAKSCLRATSMKLQA